MTLKFESSSLDFILMSFFLLDDDMARFLWCQNRSICSLLSNSQIRRVRFVFTETKLRMSSRFSKCSENFSLRRASRLFLQRNLIWQLRLLKNDDLCLVIVLTPLMSSLMSSLSNFWSAGWLSAFFSFLCKAVLFKVLFFFLYGNSF